MQSAEINFRWQIASDKLQRNADTRLKDKLLLVPFIFMSLGGISIRPPRPRKLRIAPFCPNSAKLRLLRCSSSSPNGYAVRGPLLAMCRLNVKLTYVILIVRQFSFKAARFLLRLSDIGKRPQKGRCSSEINRTTAN